MPYFVVLALFRRLSRLCDWDETSRFNEVFAGVVVFVKKSSGLVCFRLVGVDLLAHPLTAPETVGVVMRMLLPTPFKLSALVAAIFDRCSTNYAAYDILVGVS